MACLENKIKVSGEYNQLIPRLLIYIALIQSDFSTCFKIKCIDSAAILESSFSPESKDNSIQVPVISYRNWYNKKTFKINREKLPF